MLHPLEILKDRIVDSQTHHIGRFIDEESIRILQSYIPDFEDYIPDLNSLYKKIGTTLNILDYDETLQQRHYQLQLGLLQDNRGTDGNRVIQELLGSQNFLDVYYRRSSIVQRIAQILEMQDDFHQARILTAGEKDWQFSKIKTTKVYDEKNGIWVVDASERKIQKVLDIVLELGYIPSKIIIYEDRPEHFHRSAEALSKFLGGTEIVINKVILSQEEVIKKQIASISQKIYKTGFTR